MYGLEEVDRKLEGNREERVGMGAGVGKRGQGQGTGVYNPGSRNVKLEGKRKFQVVGVFVYLNGYRAHAW